MLVGAVMDTMKLSIGRSVLNDNRLISRMEEAKTFQTRQFS
jgi:hypothetical protein